jgi:hypothetical protein
MRIMERRTTHIPGSVAGLGDASGRGSMPGAAATAFGMEGKKRVSERAREGERRRVRE